MKHMDIKIRLFFDDSEITAEEAKEIFQEMEVCIMHNLVTWTENISFEAGET